MPNPFGEDQRRPRRAGRFGLSVTSSVIVSLILIACGGAAIQSGIAETGLQALESEKNISNNAVARIHKNEPVPVLNDSSDAHNQRIFYTEQSDPNKVEYLELLALDGTPIAHFTIKGQVSAMDTSLTNPTQQLCTQGSEHREEGRGCDPVGLAEPNGIYQGADAGHFAITTSGALIEWEGNFVTSDQPFNIKIPTKLVLNESAAPTATDTSHVTANAVLPNGRTH
jgi:hypothetical protein